MGKLAKSLRILGFDTIYENSYGERDIVRISSQESRIVLSRSIRIISNSAIFSGFLIKSVNVDLQLQELIREFDLIPDFKPYTRCLICNGAIVPVEKTGILNRLPPNTALYFDEFYQCLQCGKVYWKGSHYDRMEKFIRGYL